MTDSSAGTTSAGTRSSYQLFMLALCAIALAFLAVQSSPSLDGESRAILEYADFAICILFFIDFVYSFATAPDRLKYMRTWGWIDLVSSIPVVGPSVDTSNPAIDVHRKSGHHADELRLVSGRP